MQAATNPLALQYALKFANANAKASANMWAHTYNPNTYRPVSIHQIPQRMWDNNRTLRNIAFTNAMLGSQFAYKYHMPGNSTVYRKRGGKQNKAKTKPNKKRKTQKTKSN